MSSEYENLGISLHYIFSDFIVCRIIGIGIVLVAVYEVLKDHVYLCICMYILSVQMFS